jgi:HEAT repeat protein
VRNWAATILGNIGDDAALQALAGAMSDSSREVRDAAIAAIGKFDADTAANTFADALESGSRDAQATALVALARMGAGAGPAIPAVAQAAGASESLISNTAINTLGDIATPEAAAALGELARDMDLGMDYRKQAIQSLQRIGGEVAAGELQQVSDALADEDGADDLRALLQ